MIYLVLQVIFSNCQTVPKHGTAWHVGPTWKRDNLKGLPHDQLCAKKGTI